MQITTVKCRTARAEPKIEQCGFDPTKSADRQKNTRYHCCTIPALYPCSLSVCRGYLYAFNEFIQPELFKQPRGSIKDSRNKKRMILPQTECNDKDNGGSAYLMLARSSGGAQKKHRGQVHSEFSSRKVDEPPLWWEIKRIGIFYADS